MIGTTISLTVNSVAKVLKRVSDSEPYSATYFLSESTTEYTLNIKHTVPATRGASKESHLARLDVVEYDTDGIVLRKQSCWAVYETSIGRQDDTTAGYYAKALADFQTTTNIGLLLARDS